jgi:hypothetical protein
LPIAVAVTVKGGEMIFGLNPLAGPAG